MPRNQENKRATISSSPRENLSPDVDDGAEDIVSLWGHSVSNSLTL